VSAELNNDQNQDQKAAADNLNAKTATPPPTAAIQRTRSNGGYRMGKVSPAIDPPSPKLSACGFCTAFSKTGEKGRRRAKPTAKHRSR